MAQFLSSARPRRRAAAVALVAVVIAVHLFVTQRVAQRMADFATQRAMPPRISVTYVRELELAPPPAAPPVVVAPARPRKRAGAAPAAARPASAPMVAEAERGPIAAEPEPATQLEPGGGAGAVAEAPPASAPAMEQASAEPAAAPASAAEAFQWPTSTRLTYELTGNYRGEINGDAQVEWVRVGTHYQVNIDISLGPLISRRMTSEGELVGDRLLPSRYDEVTKVLFREPRRVTILMGPEEVVLATGARLERAAGLQDAASQFIQLTAMFTTRPDLLRAGNSIEVVLALRNRVGSWVYDTLGEEDIWTPLGTLATYHLKPRRVISNGNELSAEIWFSPQLRYLPARLRIRQDAETFVDLVLSRRPEIAEQ
jgi:hypothetical protein